MKTLHFSNNDQMPALGLGTWKSRPGEVGAAIRTAIKLGYRHIDCAAIYGNEAEIGQALADAIKSGEVTRNELWITSKLWNNAHLEQDVRPALEKTLKDLQLDYLDLYLIHWSIAHRPDCMMPKSREEFLSNEEAPIARTWSAMEACADAGLTRHIGVSNFNIQKLEEISKNARIRPEMNQVELHPFLPQQKLVEFCQTNGIHLTAYSPLGSLDRSANLKANNEPSLLQHPDVQTLAKKYHATPAQVLIAWSLHRGTAVIPKSTNEGRLRENLASADLGLTEEDMQQLAAIGTSFRFVDGSLWTRNQSPYTYDDLWEME